MRCIRPLKASQNAAGDIVYSSKKAVPGLVGFEFECRKCLPCRLNIAREKAIRSVHESMMHKDNIFLTLTYHPDHLVSDRLIYQDWQAFIKALRNKIAYEKSKEVNRGLTKEEVDELYIPVMVTGEYGEKNKRPHWHALLFNYRPPDAEYKYTTDHGERVFRSEILSEIWKKGELEFGSVTMDSAGYVARYAAKKLVHGKDQDHEFHPIHKVSSRRAIGRSWIEKYYKHTFENGFVVLPNGELSKIPRYYVDWCKKYKPEMYAYYVSEVREGIIQKAEAKARKEEIDYCSNVLSYNGGAEYPPSRSKVKETILKSRFKRLQENLKL